MINVEDNINVHFVFALGALYVEGLCPDGGVESVIEFISLTERQAAAANQLR